MTAAEISVGSWRMSRALVQVAGWGSVLGGLLLLALAAATYLDIKINEGMARFEGLPVSEHPHLGLYILAMVAVASAWVAGAGVLWFGDARLVKVGRLVLIGVSATVGVAMVVVFDAGPEPSAESWLALLSGVILVTASVSTPTERIGWG